MTDFREHESGSALGRITRTATVAVAVVVALVVALALGTGTAAAQTEIDSCTTIDSPGSYVLNQSITDTTDSSCIVVQSDDVVLDGGGHTVANESANDNRNGGIDVTNGSRTISNVTVRDVRVENFSYGIEYRRVDDGRIEDVETSVVGTAIFVDQGTNDTVRNATTEKRIYPLERTTWSPGVRWSETPNSSRPASLSVLRVR